MSLELPEEEAPEVAPWIPPIEPEVPEVPVALEPLVPLVVPTSEAPEDAPVG